MASEAMGEWKEMAWNAVVAGYRELKVESAVQVQGSKQILEWSDVIMGDQHFPVEPWSLVVACFGLHFWINLGIPYAHLHKLIPQSNKDPFKGLTSPNIRFPYAQAKDQTSDRIVERPKHLPLVPHYVGSLLAYFAYVRLWSYGRRICR